MEPINMALVKADEAALAQYALFSTERDAITALQRSVGSQLSINDLPKITTTISGKFSVPSIAGTSEVESVEGVVVFNNLWRGLYPKKFSKKESGAVPQCHSIGGIYGIGDPGGECATCPFNEWGSSATFYGDGSRAKACKEFWLLYLWRAGKRRPELLQVPATSIGFVRQYMMGLLDYTELDGLSLEENGEAVPMPILGVITRFTMQEVKGQSRVVLQVAGVLPEVVWPHTVKASAFIASMLATQGRTQPARPKVTPSGYDTAEDVIEAGARTAQPKPQAPSVRMPIEAEPGTPAPARLATPSRPPRRMPTQPVGPPLAANGEELIDLDL